MPPQRPVGTKAKRGTRRSPPGGMIHRGLYYPGGHFFPNQYDVGLPRAEGPQKMARPVLTPKQARIDHEEGEAEAHPYDFPGPEWDEWELNDYWAGRSDIPPNLGPHQYARLDQGPPNLVPPGDDASSDEWERYLSAQRRTLTDKDSKRHDRRRRALAGEMTWEEYMGQEALPPRSDGTDAYGRPINLPRASGPPRRFAREQGQPEAITGSVGPASPVDEPYVPSPPDSAVSEHTLAPMDTPTAWLQLGRAPDGRDYMDLWQRLYALHAGRWYHRDIQPSWSARPEHGGERRVHDTVRKTARSVLQGDFDSLVPLRDLLEDYHPTALRIDPVLRRLPHFHEQIRFMLDNGRLTSSPVRQRRRRFAREQGQPEAITGSVGPASDPDEPYQPADQPEPPFPQIRGVSPLWGQMVGSGPDNNQSHQAAFWSLVGLSRGRWGYGTRGSRTPHRTLPSLALQALQGDFDALIPLHDQIETYHPEVLNSPLGRLPYLHAWFQRQLSRQGGTPARQRRRSRPGNRGRKARYAARPIPYGLPANLPEDADPIPGGGGISAGLTSRQEAVPIKPGLPTRPGGRQGRALDAAVSSLRDTVHQQDPGPSWGNQDDLYKLLSALNHIPGTGLNSDDPETVRRAAMAADPKDVAAMYQGLHGERIHPENARRGLVAIAADPAGTSEIFGRKLMEGIRKQQVSRFLRQTNIVNVLEGVLDPRGDFPPQLRHTAQAALDGDETALAALQDQLQDHGHRWGQLPLGKVARALQRHHTHELAAPEESRVSRLWNKIDHAFRGPRVFTPEEQAANQRDVGAWRSIGEAEGIRVRTPTGLPNPPPGPEPLGDMPGEPIDLSGPEPPSYPTGSSGTSDYDRARVEQAARVARRPKLRRKVKRA